MLLRGAEILAPALARTQWPKYETAYSGILLTVLYYSKTTDGVSQLSPWIHLDGLSFSDISGWVWLVWASDWWLQSDVEFLQNVDQAQLLRRRLLYF